MTLKHKHGKSLMEISLEKFSTTARAVLARIPEEGAES